MKIEGAVALVTGGAQGLGKAFSDALLARKAKVVMVDLNAEVGQGTLKELQTKYGQNNVSFFRCDITNRKEIEEVFRRAKETFGGLDIVVNNAGLGGESADLWEKCVDVNLKGVIRGSMLAMEYMRTDKGGRGGVIINISSMAGLNPNPYGPVYSATKHGILGFTRSWALNQDLTKHGVRMNVLCPSFVATAMTKSLSQPGASLNPTAALAFVEQHGVMEPSYVAEGMVELVEDDSRNGAVLKMAKSFGRQYHAN